MNQELSNELNGIGNSRYSKIIYNLQLLSKLNIPKQHCRRDLIPCQLILNRPYIAT